MGAIPHTRHSLGINRHKASRCSRAHKLLDAWRFERYQSKNGTLWGPEEDFYSGSSCSTWIGRGLNFRSVQYVFLNGLTHAPILIRRMVKER